MAKTKAHKLIVSVSFDKAITPAQAAKLFKDAVYGDFYPDSFSMMDDGPDLMKVKTAKPAPAPHA